MVTTVKEFIGKCEIFCVIQTNKYVINIQYVIYDERLKLFIQNVEFHLLNYCVLNMCKILTTK